jgi:hypothetical protein
MPSRIVWILTALVGASVSADGQWVNHPTPGIPRTRDGKANLSAPAPRASNGKPDLTGLWQVDPTPYDELTRLFGDLSAFSVPGDDAHSLSKYLVNILADFKPDESPLRPEAAALFRQHAEALGKDNPTSRCLPAGVPSAALLPFPHKIVQTPGLIVILYEGDNTVRQIYTDGRRHPAERDPMWLGYSVGSWEGDSLVIDTVGFNDKGWLDVFGHPHSEALHVVERLRRHDFGHMEVQVAIDDPQTFTRPFAVKFNESLLPDTDILESFCTENEKDRAHMPGH